MNNENRPMGENGNRDYGGEIDQLKAGLTEIKDMLGQIFRHDNDGNVQINFPHSSDLRQEKSAPKPNESEKQETPEQDDEERSINEDKAEEPRRPDNWAEYGRQMSDYGKQIADHYMDKYGSMCWNDVFRQQRSPRPPKLQKPPKPPKPPKNSMFCGTGLDKIGETVRQMLNQSFREMEESLRNMDINIDMVDLSFKPQMDSIASWLADNEMGGIVTYVGGFKSYDGTMVTWSAKERTFDNILTSLHSFDAEKVLGAIGSRQKLDILLALLHAPMTVNEIVAYLHLNTTGQAYHHLHNLLAAKLVVEVPGSKGVYAINPSRVQGLIMILAGVRDLLSAKDGNDAEWEIQED